MTIALRRFGLKTAAFISAVSLAACGGGGGGGGSSPAAPILPVVTPTPPPGPPTTAAACLPFGGVGGQSVARSPQSVSPAEPHRMPSRAGKLEFEPGMLLVKYRSAANTTAAASTGARSIQRLQIGSNTYHTYAVDEARLTSTMATLKADPSVEDVSRVRARYISSAQPLLTNDPYFSQPANTKNVPPPGPPCYETAATAGQWDMHQIGLERAFGYSQAAGNTAPGGANANALGNPSIKIAIIDTGADITHPELSSKIVYKRCFITTTGLPAGTDCNGDPQNIKDYDGHGTNVAGIAAAQTNNGFGYAGAGGNVSLMIYRVFPQPPAAGCDPSATTPSPQCTTSEADEVSAINDAVQNGARVINLSLGATGSSPLEQQAVANAINQGVVVVAASGNGNSSGVGQPKLDCPACYSGVVAVGATAINDSLTPNIEYVAKYSNYDSSNPAWGIVAPGADPTGPQDTDYLHWINNIFSNDATIQSSAGTTPTKCTTDAASSLFGEVGDCRVLIAGTSQATPHVAGAVGLLLSVAPGMTPAQVRAALQASAHDIQDIKEGYGRLDEYRLIGTALGDTNLPPK